MKNKILIIYFSREGNNYVNGNIINLPIGNTEIVAKTIAKISGGDLFKVISSTAYSEDYNECTRQAKEELRSNARPELISSPERIDQYDTIILGYPNWWGTMPMPVWTFLEKFDFTGKTIYPFCTHEGSGLGNSEAHIRTLCPTATVKKGLAILGSNVNSANNDIEEWLNNKNN